VSVWKYIRIGKKRRYCKPAIGKNGKIKPDWGDVAVLRTGDVLVESPIRRTSEQYVTASTILPFLLKEPDLLSHEEPSPGVVPKSMPLERSSSRRA